MDVDFQIGLLRGKVRVKKNPPRSGVVSVYDHRIKNHLQGLPLKFQGVPFGSLTGSEPEITTPDHISDCLGAYGINPSFRFHNSVHQF